MCFGILLATLRAASTNRLSNPRATLQKKWPMFKNVQQKSSCHSYVSIGSESRAEECVVSHLLLANWRTNVFGFPIDWLTVFLSFGPIDSIFLASLTKSSIFFLACKESSFFRSRSWVLIFTTTDLETGRVCFSFVAFSLTTFALSSSLGSLVLNRRAAAKWLKQPEKLKYIKIELIKDK